MKSEHVTKAWEFYRDDCQGFKEPMRQEFRKLDDYVSGLEDENAKLRKLTDELWALAYGYVPYESELDAARDMMRELGIEEDA